MVLSVTHTRANGDAGCARVLRSPTLTTGITRPNLFDSNFYAYCNLSLTARYVSWRARLNGQELAAAVLPLRF